MPDWALEFRNFSTLHLATVLGFVLLWTLLAVGGRAVAGSAREARWRAALCASLALAWLTANGAQFRPGYFVAASNLPLHACDLAGILAPLALWRRTRVLLGVLYFWGLGFSVQAILTPDLDEGPARAGFWMFWVPHANITGAACYALVVERFRPGWRECLQAYGLAVLYLALILPFDLVTGFNYGYVGPQTPSQPTLLDFLGPWPWRIGSMMALAFAVFVAMLLPWLPPRGSQKPRSVA